MHRRLFLGLLALFTAGQMACVDISKAGGGDTALYLHSVESGTAKIRVFTDLATLFTSTGSLTASKTLTSSLLSQAVPLAWGGMVLDSQGNSLYIVGETGTVIRIDRLRSQTGDIPSTSADVVSFTLGSSSDRLSGGKFGQAAFDSSTKTLFITESNSSRDTQIWVVSSPGLISPGATVARQLVFLTPGDKAGSGLAAGQGALYGFFNEGNRLDVTDSWVGPRLRKGSASAFPLFASVLGGDRTLIGIHGSMALDTGNNLLYFARHNVASSTSGDPSPIMVFSVGQFSGAPNQAPDHLAGNGSQMGNLRVLSHAGNKDWLGGLTSDVDLGNNFFWLWKEPKAGVNSPVRLDLSTGAIIRGLAFDGSN